MDIGTSSTRSALFDERGNRIAATSASEKYAARYTVDGGAELKPETLRRAAESCLRQTLAARTRSTLLRRVPIAVISGSGFWHSLLGLDNRGRPITPIFTWADARCADDAHQLREKFSEQKIHARTGCMLRASFWPAKLVWLRRTKPRLFSRVARWASPADWIFAQMFGATGSSQSMASATGLYNLKTRTWDEELCQYCRVDVDLLSEITDRSVSSSRIRKEFRDAQIFTAIGDGAASNLGSGASGGNRVAINIGTSGAVRMIKPRGNRHVPFGLFRYVVDDAREVVGGAISNAGNLRAWGLRELRVDKIDMSRAGAATDPLTVLPFWVSERAPTWPEHLPGVITGLTQAARAPQILRAIVTSTYYRLADILELMETTAGRAREIIVSGGVAHSPASLRLLADALGRNLTICEELEASLRGAAMHGLERFGRALPSTAKGKTIQHDRALAAQHRQRRQRQNALEKLLR
ncbi:MAG: gluconokinase [Verrucomicrobiota bacterium]